ncbi:sulfotransferase family protein [Thiocapsa marina]|nr:sulfotransferase [Thiocapsa marina]
MRNVVLLSTSYSGSTLVSMLVSSHPHVIGFGDTYNYQFVTLGKTRCTCGAVPSVACPVRTGIESRMRAMGEDFSWLTSNPTPLPRLLRSSRIATTISRSDRWLPFYRALPQTARQRLLGGYYRENAKFFEALAQSGPYTHYFDGCKSLFRLELMRSLFPDTLVVHLIKNPKAYLHSFLTREEMRYQSVIDYWLKYHDESRRFAELLGQGNYMLVTFEELTRYPEQSLRELYRFIGVPERDEPFEQWINLKTVHVVGSGTKNQYRRVEEKAPRWKSELTREQLTYIDRRIAQVPWLEPILPRLDWA